MKRVFLIVLDSMGIGYEPDADLFGDVGANTLKTIRNNKHFNCPNLQKMGLFNIDGVDDNDSNNQFKSVKNPTASYARLQERSMGKDTTIGHWEIAGLVSKEPLPTFPDGFPDELIKKFEDATGHKALCNKPYSGTEVIKDYGKQHLETGDLIVYTSADSVFQIAAHEDLVPVDTLYKYCQIARDMLVGKYGVGRVIARPFTGDWPYTRTANRHDFSLQPPEDTMLDLLKDSGKETLSVGKIYDIFAGAGITKMQRTKSNENGMQVTLEKSKEDFEGLCFTNLVDFDMKYGHRRDIDGYANAMTTFDRWLPSFLENMRPDDILMITADHGCDPGYTKTTDHTREYIPLIAYGQKVKKGIDLGTRLGFCDISATILDYFNTDKKQTHGKSFLNKIL